jgi:hypothetical protein
MVMGSMTSAAKPPETAASDWRIVRPQALAVLCLRHRGLGQDRTATWRALTEFALASGLCGPGSRPIGVVYDDPAQNPPGWVRYDACISVAPHRLGEIGGLKLADEVARVGQLRVEAVMNDGPLLNVQPNEVGGEEAVSHALASADLAAIGLPTLAACRPVFQVYRRNPALVDGCPKIVETFLSIRRAAPTQQRGCGPVRHGRRRLPSGLEVPTKP